MELGQKLKEKRLELGLTQRQAADMIGVSQMTICKWERGARIGGDYVGAVENFISDDDVLQPPAVDLTLRETQMEEPTPEPDPDPELPPEPQLPPLFRYMVIMKDDLEFKVIAEAVSIVIKPEIRLFAFTTQGRRVAMFKMDDVIGFYEDIEIER